MFFSNQYFAQRYYPENYFCVWPSNGQFISLIASIASVSVTPEIDSSILRSMVAEIAGVSITPGIDSSLLRALEALIACESETPDIESLILRSMVALIVSASVTPNIILNMFPGGSFIIGKRRFIEAVNRTKSVSAINRYLNVDKI